MFDQGNSLGDREIIPPMDNGETVRWMTCSVLEAHKGETPCTVSGHSVNSRILRFNWVTPNKPNGNHAMRDSTTRRCERDGYTAEDTNTGFGVRESSGEPVSFDRELS